MNAASATRHALRALKSHLAPADAGALGGVVSSTNECSARHFWAQLFQKLSDGPHD